MLIGYIVLVFPVVAVISALIYAPFFVYVRRQYGKQAKMFHLVRYALIGCSLSLIYLTILWYYPDITFHPKYHFLNLRPFIWVTEVYTMGAKKMVEQLILNVGMFVPLGMLLPMAFSRTRMLWKTGGIVLCVTVGIETLQYFMGRSADVDDVIMNVIGGLIGYGVFKVLDQSFGQKTWWCNALNLKI